MGHMKIVVFPPLFVTLKFNLMPEALTRRNFNVLERDFHDHEDRIMKNALAKF